MAVENDVKVPSQVDEAVELAEKLFAQMNPSKEEDKEPTTLETDEDTEDEDVEVEDIDEDEDNEPEIDPKELKKWRDRYLTLKGKYDAEVPRLASQVKELMEKVSTPSKKEDLPLEEDDIAKFESIYGPDFLKQIRKVIDQEVQAKITPVSEKITSVEDTQKQAATESFMAYLDENADGWRNCWEGKDKGFQKFIEQKDPMGLATYADYLTRFNTEWDAEGMAKIFNLYNQSKTNKPDVSKQKEAMIAPSRAKATQQPASNEKPIWTEESIKQFERDDRAGKYSDAESQEKWTDLLAAANEGRIR